MIILRQKEYSKFTETAKGSLKGTGWGAGIGYVAGAGIALQAGEDMKHVHRAGKIGAMIGAGMGAVNGGMIGYKKEPKIPKPKQITLQEFKQLLPPQYSKWLRIAKDGKTIQLQKDISKFNYKIYPLFQVPDIKDMFEEYKESGSCTILNLADYGSSVDSLTWIPTEKRWVGKIQNPDEEIKYSYDCLLEFIVEEIEDDNYTNKVEIFTDYIKSKL